MTAKPNVWPPHRRVAVYHGREYEVVWSGAIDKHADGLLTSHWLRWRSPLTHLFRDKENCSPCN
jgi:hypothetical protein